MFNLSVLILPEQERKIKKEKLKLNEFFLYAHKVKLTQIKLFSGNLHYNVKLINFVNN